MNKQRLKHYKYAGFTLLELILVMVILSTVLAMAAPSLRGFFTSRKTQDAAAQILALTQLMTSQSVSEGRMYRLNLETDTGKYWITAQQGGAFEKLKTEFGREFTLPKDVRMEVTDFEQDGEESYIEFTPHGTVTPGTISLLDRRNRRIDIISPSATEVFYVIEEEL